MKIRIEYTYIIGNAFPFVAGCDFKGRWITENSRLSFESAKELLLDKIKNAEYNTVIPPSEEIEIEDV